MNKNYPNEEDYDAWRDLFQERFENFEAPPPPEGWKRVRPAFWWWFPHGLFGGVLLLLLVGGFFMFSGEKESEGETLLTEKVVKKSQKKLFESVKQKETPQRKEEEKMQQENSNYRPDYERLSSIAQKQKQRKEATSLQSRTTLKSLQSIETLLPRKDEKVKVDLLTTLPYRSFPDTTFTEVLPEKLDSSLVSETSKGEKKSSWRIYGGADVMFWHLSSAPIAFSQYTAFSERPIPNWSNRLSGNVGISWERKLSSRWALSLSLGYRMIQENIDYQTQKAVIQDLSALSQTDNFSTFPQYRHSEHEHRHNLHLLGLGAGISYQLRKNYHLGTSLISQGLLTQKGFRQVLASEFFLRNSTNRLEVSPLVTYFWQRTTPAAVPFRARPYSFGLRVGWRW